MTKKVIFHKNRLLLILLLVGVFSSCSKIYSVLRKDVDSEGKTDIKSKFNDDNKVYTTNRLFSYNVHQIDAARELNYKMELLVIPGKYNGGTKIKYKLYYTEENLTLKEREEYIDSNKLYKWDITNVMEDDEGVWIHPPRSYTLEKLQLSPFPQIDFPAKIGDNWASRMYIGAGWGDLRGKTVSSDYIVESVKYSETDSLNFTARVKAETYFDEENHLCKAVFDFDSQLGFTNMSYVFDDSTKVEIRLVE